MMTVGDWQTILINNLYGVFGGDAFAWREDTAEIEWVDGTEHDQFAIECDIAHLAN